jgi:hypothetical protein
MLLRQFCMWYRINCTLSLYRCNSVFFFFKFYCQHSQYTTIIVLHLANVWCPLDTKMNHNIYCGCVITFFLTYRRIILKSLVLHDISIKAFNIGMLSPQNSKAFMKWTWIFRSLWYWKHNYYVTLQVPDYIYTVYIFFFWLIWTTVVYFSTQGIS